MPKLRHSRARIQMEDFTPVSLDPCLRRGDEKNELAHFVVGTMGDLKVCSFRVWAVDLFLALANWGYLRGRSQRRMEVLKTQGAK